MGQDRKLLVKIRELPMSVLQQIDSGKLAIRQQPGRWQRAVPVENGIMGDQSIHVKLESLGAGVRLIQYRSG